MKKDLENKDDNEQSNKKIVIFLFVIFVLGMSVFVLFVNSLNRDRQETAIESETPVTVIGVVTEIIKEEVPILNTIKYKTTGYKVQVLLPCSDDFAEEDETTLCFLYSKTGENKDGPTELNTGDIIIVNYFKSAHYCRDGIDIVENGTILYGSKEQLMLLERKTNGKVVDLIKKFYSS